MNSSSKRSSNTWACGMSSANRPRELMWYIRRRRSPPSEATILYDECSSPSADDPPSLLLLRRDRLPDRCGSFDPEALDRLSDGYLPLKKIQLQAKR